jgi:hypothetical protein
MQDKAVTRGVISDNQTLTHISRRKREFGTSVMANGKIFTYIVVIRET